MPRAVFENQQCHLSIGMVSVSDTQTKIHSSNIATYAIANLPDRMRLNSLPFGNFH